MKKKLLAGALSVAMLFGAAAALPEDFSKDLGIKIGADAANPSDSYYYSKDLDDGTVEIIGYLGPDTDITIPSKLSDKTVTRIGNGAFKNSGITGVTIPDSVTSIGDEAFMSCKKLTSVTIPSSVTSIGENAFCWCESLTSVTIPNGVKKISEMLFYGCESLTSVTIPDGVTSIGRFAFDGCESLASITIPDSVTSIGSWAFTDCKSFTSIDIPESVESIGDAVFSGCVKLSYINVDRNNDVYSSYNGILYSNAGKTLIRCPQGKKGSVTIPDGVTALGEGAFAFCEGLTSITVPDSVTSIGDAAFSTCKGLTSIKIPNGVTNIGNSVFTTCESLTSITIPDSVTSIGRFAFNECKNLASITIPDSVTSIGESAFEYCSSLTSITIPNSVTSIGTYAFFDCFRLTSITIPNSVTSISDYAFFGCTSLTSITIPNSVTSIGDCAFYKCTSLTSITIPKSVTSMGDDAFWGCNNLTIKCYPDSEAEKYAKANDIKYVLLDSIADAKISLEYSAYTYTGSPISVEKYLTVKVGSKVLVNGTDYTVSYKNNTKVGYQTATMTLTGKGNYTGSVSKKFTIKPAKLAAPTLTTGKGITVSWKADSSAVGYQVQYCKDSSFTKDVHSTTVVGKTTVNLTSIPKPGETWYVKVRAFISSDGTTSGTRYGNYSSAKSITLKKALKTVSIEYSSYTYTGSTIKPKIVSVKDSDGNKLTTSDYSVSYSNNTKVGIATMKITGKGKYQGTVKKTFVIKPKPGTLTLTTTSGAFKATWPKDTSASGYEIVYSKDKTFKTGVTTYNVSKNTTTSVNFSSKPNSGETWYVKYRAYVTVNGTKYGNFSSVKSIKVK